MPQHQPAQQDAKTPASEEHAIVDSSSSLEKLLLELEDEDEDDGDDILDSVPFQDAQHASNTDYDCDDEQLKKMLVPDAEMLSNSQAVEDQQICQSSICKEECNQESDLLKTVPQEPVVQGDDKSLLPNPKLNVLDMNEVEMTPETDKQLEDPEVAHQMPDEEPMEEDEVTEERQKVVTKKCIIKRDYLVMWSCPPGEMFYRWNTV